MNTLTCLDVADRLDLFAADECAAAEAQAIRGHLAHCVECAKAYVEAQDLMALLDLRLQEPERLQRLADHIEAEADPRPRVRRFPTGLRRVAALAALLLLAVGPILWLRSDLQPGESNGGLVAVLRPPDQRGGPEAVPRIAKLAAPEKIDLSFRLTNTTDRPMQIWVAGPHTERRFEVRGPAAVRRPVPDIPAKAEIVTLPPGGDITIPVHELVEGPPAARRAWDFTQPGDYTVTARFTTSAWSPGIGQRRLTVESAPLTIHHDGN